ncbi:MAG TPA: TIGR03435 family protein [Bryobacteraceae bacterium]|nr:TIGR03435 family protein [Bryobacteraceae bacterium]
MKTKFIIPIFAASLCFAAQPATEPAFEAASIHANPESGKPDIQQTPGSLTIRNQPYRVLIEWAWDISSVQIEGPSWINDRRFDIVAKASGPANEAQLRLMLRRLLADRFGLKFHMDSRPISSFALTVAKGGPKFQESSGEGTMKFENTNSFMLVAHHVTMADLAHSIANEAGRPVIDETGLKGRYEIRMDLTPYVQRAAEANGGSPGQVDPAAILFNGLQELLGLKLESRKAPVDVFVIDHLEGPSEN